MGIVEEVKNIKTESKEEVDKVKGNLLIKENSISEQLEEQNTKEKKISQKNDSLGESLSELNKKLEVIPTSIDLSLIDAPGPCVPQDLIEGIIFSASYLGS